MLWGALFVLAVLVRDADTAGDAVAVDAIAATGMLYVLERIMSDYQAGSLMLLPPPKDVHGTDHYGTQTFNTP